MNPVKTHQSVKCSQPEITVLRLEDGNDFAVRQMPASALQEFTMNGPPDSSTGPATAERASAKTQSGSPANRNALDFFSIIGLEHPGGCKMFGERYKSGGKEEKVFFKNHLPLRRGGLSLPCPTRTGRLGGCRRCKSCVIAASAIFFVGFFLASAPFAV